MIIYKGHEFTVTHMSHDTPYYKCEKCNIIVFKSTSSTSDELILKYSLSNNDYKSHEMLTCDEQIIKSIIK